MCVGGGGWGCPQPHTTSALFWGPACGFCKQQEAGGKTAQRRNGGAAEISSQSFPRTVCCCLPSSKEQEDKNPGLTLCPVISDALTLGGERTTGSKAYCKPGHCWRLRLQPENPKVPEQKYLHRPGSPGTSLLLLLGQPPFPEAWFIMILGEWRGSRSHRASEAPYHPQSYARFLTFLQNAPIPDVEEGERCCK